MSRKSSSPKTRPGPESVEAFVAGIADDSRRADCAALVEMMRSATGEPPVLWGGSIVGFGRYRYRYESGHRGEFFLTGFASRKRALVVYVMPGFSGYPELMERLGRYDTGKSCLYLKRLADVDLDVLSELVTRSVADMIDRYPPED